MTGVDPDLREAPYPLEAHLGYLLTEWRKDFARVEMPRTAEIGNRQGLPHGGVYATLLDTAMGYCGCFSGQAGAPKMALTLSLTVNFMGRTNGNHFIATARRTGGGQKTFFASAEVCDEYGVVLASGTGVFRYRSSS